MIDFDFFIMLMIFKKIQNHFILSNQNMYFYNFIDLD